MTDSRDRILTCACDLFLRHGLDGFSMRRVARSLGVTPPALYRHYEGREELLHAVLGEGYKLLSQYLYTALAGSTPLERFRLATDAYLDFALENARYYSVMYALPEVLGLEDCDGEAAPEMMAVHHFWNDRVRDCMDEGILREGDPEAVGLTLWAHAFGLISIYHRGMLPVDEASFRGLFWDSSHRLLQGLGTDAYVSDGFRGRAATHAPAAVIPFPESV
ncbi:MAG: TetR/AcrR family transcriptional regulator [Gemmatimonadota bacterium]